MEVAADREPEGRHAGHELPHLGGHADADRVGEHDLVRTEAGDRLGQAEDLRGLDAALERAAEGHADRDRHRQPVVVGAADDPLGDAQRVADGHALVALAERVGGREGVVDLVDAGGHRAVVAALVEHQSGVDDALDAMQRRHDLLGPRHLRHALGVHEADGLDARDARGGQAVAELRPDLRGQRAGLVLQAVARPDVADLDAGHTMSASLRRASSASSMPSRPP